MRNFRYHNPTEVVFGKGSIAELPGLIPADAVVLMTEWNQYRALDLDRLMQEMQGRIFIDLRNVYEPQKMKDKGFIYAGVGRS